MEIRGKKTTKVVEYEPIEEVLCNKCGKSVRIVHTTAYGDEIVFYEGTRLTGDFGYGSNKDGVCEHFDLCDACYDDFISTFKHEPTAR